MSLPNLVVMPGDGAENPFTIPGTARKYSCTAGSAISVVGEDAAILRNVGWIGAGPGTRITHSGPTTARPTPDLPGEGYVDTTVNAIVIWGGPKTGWLNAATGASA
jgi:hypothetical protein